MSLPPDDPLRTLLADLRAAASKPWTGLPVLVRAGEIADRLDIALAQHEVALRARVVAAIDTVSPFPHAATKAAVLAALGTDRE
jgi:hypothetical protein